MKTEKMVGHLQFLLIYFVSGIGGGIVSSTYHMLVKDGAVSVGASGAIYGLFGLIIVSMILYGNIREEGLRILFVLFLLIAGSANEQIDMADHMGGLLIGAIVSLGVLLRRDIDYEG